jgi:hypothetical protein
MEQWATFLLVGLWYVTVTKLRDTGEDIDTNSDHGSLTEILEYDVI